MYSHRYLRHPHQRCSDKVSHSFCFAAKTTVRSLPADAAVVVDMDKGGNTHFICIPQLLSLNSRVSMKSNYVSGKRLCGVS